MRSKLQLMSIILLLLGVWASPVLSAAELPDTPCGNYVARLLEALNSGDEQIWQAFLLEDAKAAADSAVFERRFGAFQMIYNDVGGVDLHQVTEFSDFSTSMLCKARQQNGPFDWLEFTMEIDSLPPHGWGGLSMRPATGPAEDLPPGRLSDEQLSQYLENYLAELAAEDRFSGTVLLAKDGRPIFKQVHGEACKRYGVPNQLDTKFNLGSMNKMFTGVAIVQLAQAGKLSFEDKVGEYLPDYPNREVAEKVTIHQLLTHTSGMQDYWEEIFAAPWWEIRTVQELNDVFVEEGLLFEPGAEFHYSNSGPVVLGLIIEAISGQDYYDYIREHIYEAAGMANSGCFEVDRPVPNLAIGYTLTNYDGERGDDGWRNNLFMHPAKGGPAGGGYSTVEDLLSFAKALTSHQLLNEQYTEILTAGKVEMGGPDSKYAYLFGDRVEDGQRSIGHNGGAPGISAALRIYVDSGYTVAVMSNYDMMADRIAGKIHQLLVHE